MDKDGASFQLANCSSLPEGTRPLAAGGFWLHQSLGGAPRPWTSQRRDGDGDGQRCKERHGNDLQMDVNWIMVGC